MSIFDELEWDMTLHDEARLQHVFEALKSNWLEAKAKRGQGGGSTTTDTKSEDGRAPLTSLRVDVGRERAQGAKSSRQSTPLDLPIALVSK